MPCVGVASYRAGGVTAVVVYVVTKSEFDLGRAASFGSNVNATSIPVSPIFIRNKGTVATKIFGVDPEIDGEVFVGS